MCEVAGLAGLFDDAQGVVERMVHARARRGPDGVGLEVRDGAVLGHRRLAIFDLSEAGRQPVSTEDRDVTIVFNGAIYNFRELWAELEESGCRFVSQTDTEVLIEGYGTESTLVHLRTRIVAATRGG
jgi:asparagine synthase (glutamine-hydrolysing)